jgi:hypothetical protein
MENTLFLEKWFRDSGSSEKWNNLAKRMEVLLKMLWLLIVVYYKSRIKVKNKYKNKKKIIINKRITKKIQ